MRGCGQRQVGSGIRRAAAIFTLALVALVLPAAPAAADTFVVNRTDDPAPDGCDPTDCSLREAIIAANDTTRPPTPSCCRRPPSP